MLLCAVVLPSAAQELYENKKIDYRFDNLLAEAEKGNIVAIYALGETYRYGSRYMATYKGEPDYQKAYGYFKKAADYGYPWASWEMARMYSVNELDDPDGTEEKRWLEKAFKEFKFYADNGNAEAMAKLADFYHGLHGDEYKDNLKGVYWSLRALEEGEPDGASSIATCFTYGYAVNENPAFSRAWDARWCIEAAGKGWPVNEYPEFDSLSAAGYTKNDWEFLAGPTYVQVPMYSTQQEDSIVDAALLAVDLLNQKAEDFAVELKVYKQNKSLAASSAQKTQGSFSTNLIPQARAMRRTTTAAARNAPFAVNPPTIITTAASSVREADAKTVQARHRALDVQPLQVTDNRQRLLFLRMRAGVKQICGDAEKGCENAVSRGRKTGVGFQMVTTGFEKGENSSH